MTNLLNSIEGWKAPRCRPATSSELFRENLHHIKQFAIATEETYERMEQLNANGLVRPSEAQAFILLMEGFLACVEETLNIANNEMQGIRTGVTEYHDLDEAFQRTAPRH